MAYQPNSPLKLNIVPNDKPQDEAELFMRTSTEGVNPNLDNIDLERDAATTVSQEENDFHSQAARRTSVGLPAWYKRRESNALTERASPRRKSARPGTPPPFMKSRTSIDLSKASQSPYTSPVQKDTEAYSLSPQPERAYTLSPQPENKQGLYNLNMDTIDLNDSKSHATNQDANDQQDQSDIINDSPTSIPSSRNSVKGKKLPYKKANDPLSQLETKIERVSANNRNLVQAIQEQNTRLTAIEGSIAKMATTFNREVTSLKTLMEQSGRKNSACCMIF